MNTIAAPTYAGTRYRPWPPFSVFLVCAIMLLGTLHTPLAFAQVERCGDPFKSWHGPWDFRTAAKADLKQVEDVHFTPTMERGQRRADGNPLGNDFSYVLGVFPNHHRALIGMIRLGQRENSKQPTGSKLTVECWLDRAARYRPEDTVVRVLFAQYLGSEKRLDEAMVHLNTAVTHAKDNPFSHYNIGLMYFELGNHERALEQAHKAMALGLPREDLANQLKRVGAWRDPAPTPP